MSPKHLYELYRDLIPNKYIFLKYIKAQNKKSYNEEEIDVYKKYYEISEREAKEYIDLSTPKDIKYILCQITGKSIN